MCTPTTGFGLPRFPGPGDGPRPGRGGCCTSNGPAGARRLSWDGLRNGSRRSGPGSIAWSCVRSVRVAGDRGGRVVRMAKGVDSSMPGRWQRAFRVDPTCPMPRHLGARVYSGSRNCRAAFGRGAVCASNLLAVAVSHFLSPLARVYSLGFRPWVRGSAAAIVRLISCGAASPARTCR